MTQAGLVIDSAGLIALAWLGLLPALARHFGPLLITSAVLDETTPGPWPGAREITEAVAAGHAQVEEVEVETGTTLGAGEVTTIALAARLGLTAMLDDLDARQT